MAEKIIIDGVDVSGCICLDEWKHCDIYHTLIKTNGCGRNHCVLEPDLRCETYPNCDYKQKSRLEAQYNAVVEQNKSLQDELNEYKQISGKLAGKTISIASLELPREFCDHKDLTIKQLKQECEELKETLKEIQTPVFLPSGQCQNSIYFKGKSLEQWEKMEQALEPFEDEYFKDLDTKTIAELSKPLMRLRNL